MELNVRIDPRAKQLFHIRHSCGHSVYWDDALAAMAHKNMPCAWCGGETGQKAEPDTMVCFATLGAPPGHLRQSAETFCPMCERQGMVVTRHSVGCCDKFDRSKPPNPVAEN